MIGMNHLGHTGRLGNQMFQFAALAGISKSNGLDFVIPDHSMFSEYGGYRYHELQSCFLLNDVKFGNIPNSNLVRIDRYDFDQSVMTNFPDNVSVFGYFESHKYFEHIEDYIRSNFTFKPHIIEACKKYGESFLNNNPVAVVIRRGDFLNPAEIPYHPVCDISYYKEAMLDFKDRTIVVFSDDIPWCKEQEIFENSFFVESSGEIPKGHFDLCLMSMCEDFIIANSTFSWWGAWLSTNKNKKVIAPLKWFGEALQHHSIKDQIPDTWKRI